MSEPALSEGLPHETLSLQALTGLIAILMIQPTSASLSNGASLSLAQR